MCTLYALMMITLQCSVLWHLLATETIGRASNTASPAAVASRAIKANTGVSIAVASGSTVAMTEAKFVECGRQFVIVWPGLTFILFSGGALATLENTTSLLELVKRLHRQSGETMVL